MNRWPPPHRLGRFVRLAPMCLTRFSGFRAVLSSCFLIGPVLFAPLGAVAGAPPQFDLATRHLRAGNPAGARAAYEAFLAGNPQDRLAPAAAMAIAALRLRAEGDTSEALRAFDRVVALDSEGSWAAHAIREQAVCAETRRQWGMAGDLYMRALSRLPASGAGAIPASWIQEVADRAGACYEKSGDPARGIAAAETILEISPSPEATATALFRLGGAYALQGDSAKAAAHYHRLIESYPTSPLFAPALARRAWIGEHVEIDWGPYLSYARGSALVAARRYTEALANTDSTLAANPAPVLAQCAEYRKITLGALSTGDYIEGCRQLESFLKEHPTGPRSEMARSTLEENWREIAKLQEQTLAHPADGEAWTLLGATYLQMRSPRAIEALEKAVALRPDDEAAHLNLGYAYGQAQRAEEAVGEYSFYLDRHPDDTVVLNLIGYNYLAAGNATAALPYFLRYVEISPQDPNAHDSLGEGYLNAGRLEDAAREYETAVRLNPDFANSHYMLGTIYREMGRTEEAMATFERFLELTPSGAQADGARAAIEQMRASGPDAGDGTRPASR